jgi:hypothetical protein
VDRELCSLKTARQLTTMRAIEDDCVAGQPPMDLTEQQVVLSRQSAYMGAGQRIVLDRTATLISP